MRRTLSVAQLAAGELYEKVFEVRGSVQIAHAVGMRELGEQWRRVVGIAECGFARELEPVHKRAAASVRPVARLIN